MSTRNRNLFAALQAAFPADRGSLAVEAESPSGEVLAYSWKAHTLLSGVQVQGSSPPWRPVSVFDDGRRVYVVFPRGIVQGEMPPIFVIGSKGETQIVNSRVHQNILIVDRLFGAAELRLGSGKQQQTVRIVRIEQRQAAQPAKTGEQPS